MYIRLRCQPPCTVGIFGLSLFKIGFFTFCDEHTVNMRCLVKTEFISTLGPAYNEQKDAKETAR